MGEGGADAEKRVILQELQKKLTEANASLKQAVQKKRILQQATSRCNLTVQELGGLPDSIPCFEAVGRAYFRKDKKDIVEEQQQQVTDGGGQMEGLVRIAESASHEIRAIEAELSEFLKSNQDVARQFLAQSR